MNRWAQARPWLTVALRLILGGVLLVAGAIKLPDPGASVRAVRAYQLLPEAIVPTVGFVLPLAEVVLGVLLIIGLFIKWASLLGGLLMLAFIIGISSAWARGLSIDCGCFGGGGEVAQGQSKYLQEIARDTGLLLAAAFLVVWPASRWSVDSWLRGRARAAGGAELAEAEAEAAALEAEAAEEPHSAV